MDQSKPKSPFLISLITSLGLGSGGATAISYYVSESNAKAIEKLEAKQESTEKLIYQELKEINTRLSTIEGRLTK